MGRLDFNTTGLLIMTNDGDLAQKLTHPSRGVFKTYRARVEGLLSDERLDRLRKGVDIGGFVTSPANVSVVRQTEKFTVVEIKIREGRNRQVRKMLGAVGKKVVELKRVAIGEIFLGRLKEGHYRKLTRQEIEYLKEI